ncbi:MAG: hypothetical protein H8E35_09635 [Ardenticatenia bacterium]|nr:hypothetical protein [Ardenticatenia bacterium]
MDLSRLTAIVVISIAWALVSCGSPVMAPTPDVAPLKPPDAVLQPGEVLGFEPEPVGTPEENPRLLLHIAPVDESTGKPVTVPITVLLGDRVLGTGLKEYTFELPGMIAEPTDLVVKAEGYERWSLGLRYKITNTREWDVPVVLKPKPVMSVTPVEM